MLSSLSNRNLNAEREKINWFISLQVNNKKGIEKVNAWYKTKSLNIDWIWI
jgi:hypothetical protein